MYRLSDILADNDVAHVALDVDTLVTFWPRSTGDPFGEHKAVENAAAVWRNCRSGSTPRAILARCITERSEATAYADALGLRHLLVVRITTPVVVAQERLQRREGLSSRGAWFLQRVSEQAPAHAAGVADLLVENGRDVTPIAMATGLAARLGWLPEG